MRKQALRRAALPAVTAVTMSAMLAADADADPKGFETAIDTPMLSAADGWETFPLFTIGETLPSKQFPETGYTPVGILDGLGAFRKNRHTIRVLANHELLHFRGNPYELCASKQCKTTFTMTGARVSFFDINIRTGQITDSGLAYDTVVDANGNIASDKSFQPEPFATFFGGAPGDGAELEGFSRFCSSQFVKRNQFGRGRGIRNNIYFTGEEDGAGFHSVGGADWALDVKSGKLYAVPAFGRGAWENITQVDTGTRRFVAFVLADDTSPFDADDFDADQENGDAEAEAAPLYLYIGKKDRRGRDFLARNGLKDGKLFVWVADDPSVNSPLAFRGTGNETPGRWVEIDNAPTGTPSQDGSTGFDEYGYPTQRTLWTRAEALGAFGFSRPEDVATNPRNGSEYVLASTGVDNYDIDPDTGDGADSFGTLYTMDIDFSNLASPTGVLKILYDGDDDPTRALRSPDNLDWATDGLIYVQEDEAEEDTLTGEPLFGPGAVNPNEAAIVRIDPDGESGLQTVAIIDRAAVFDASLADPADAVDVDAGEAGEWESSGILDISKLVGAAPGTRFLVDVQAHGIEDQTDVNPDSRINDGDLVEGGQLLLISRVEEDNNDDDEDDDDDDDD